MRAPILTILVWLTAVGACAQPRGFGGLDPVKWVDPFIGTGGHGHTFPGATAPFGMVQLSPDTRLTGWDGCSGYHYSDDIVYGFSHTHLSGTGVSDYGDILLMPTVGDVRYHNGADGKPGYRSPFSKKTERASPGYYAVKLDNGGIGVELTATPRVGVHRYSFPKTDTANVIVDLEHRDPVLDSWLQVIGPNEIRGFRRSRLWAKDQRVWFVARFSRPFTKSEIVAGGEMSTKEGRGSAVKGSFRFDVRDGEPLVVKVALSFTDLQGPTRNLYEVDDRDFVGVREETEHLWRRELSKILIDTEDESIRKNFYTALYHCFIAPNVAQDLHTPRKALHTRYSVFSLWDTFRSLHPLFTLVQKKRTIDFVETMIRFWREHGALPIWELAGNETDCMIGYHAVSVINDAQLKGLLWRGGTRKERLSAAVMTADRDLRGLTPYRKHGFVPSDMEPESVSKTLEYAYDDWCIAKLAETARNPEIAERFYRRSQNYKNLFDPKTGFFRPRRNGGWVEPFSPNEINFHYTEANAWQYRFFVPHDVTGLAKLLGGPEKLERALDDLFTTSSKMAGRNQADVTGLIGQYAHGNEPSHGFAWLYHYLGRPSKTRDRVHQILTTLYRPTPDGLCGNEDCGQMSAWYVLSALGIYAYCPGDETWLINTPLVRRAWVTTSRGGGFGVQRIGNGKYVARVYDEVKVERPKSWVSRKNLFGTFFIETSDTPTKWGTAPEHRPRSEVKATLVPLPFVASGDAVFRDKTTVRWEVADPEAKIFVAPAYGPFVAHAEPIVLTETTQLRAYAEGGDRRSQVITATFRKIDHDWKIALATRYANQYAASGDGALIDGRTGGHDYRTGDWQGYHGVNLDAVIDLGRETEITRASIGCLQDQRSWIWMPTKIEFSTSLDGETFEPWTTVSPSTAVRADETITKRYRADGKKRARYVRVVAHNRGRCPAWHLGAGKKAWIFADEIEIQVER